MCSRRDRWWIQAKDALLLITAAWGLFILINQVYNLPIQNKHMLYNLLTNVDEIRTISFKNKDVITELRANYNSIQRDLDEIKGILKRRVSSTDVILKGPYRKHEA